MDVEVLHIESSIIEKDYCQQIWKIRGWRIDQMNTSNGVGGASVYIKI